MALLLKQLIIDFFFPMPLAFIGCILGLLLIYFRRRLAITIIVLSLLQLWLFSIPSVAGFLYSNLTNRYDPIIELDQQVDYIVVLGSSHGSVQHPSIFSTLSTTALRRLMEGMRLMDNQSKAKLWFSGNKQANRSHPVLMKEAAVELGIPTERILIYEGIHNTRAEMKTLKQNTIDGDNIIIVSSAYHLPRVALWARHYNIFPLYAPADSFRPPRIPTKGIKFVKSLIPSPYALATSNRAIHEYLGIVHWYILTRLNWLSGES